MRLDRRAVLHAMGVVGAGYLAGCGGRGEGSPGAERRSAGPPEFPGAASEYPVDRGGLNVLAFDRRGTHRTIEIGGRSDGTSTVGSGTPSGGQTEGDSYQPHEVVVYDFTGVSRIAVVIFDTLAGRAVHDASYDVPEQKDVTVRLARPSQYVVRVRADGSRHTVRVPCHFFDCNQSATRIGVVESALGGTLIRSSVVSSDAGCADSYNC